LANDGPDVWIHVHRQMGIGEMTLHSPVSGAAAAQKPPAQPCLLLTPKETATRLRLSTSWLAKARMRGDGPPYIKMGRAIRYNEAAILQWMKSRQRLSTSEA
jgi:predicted DNA-binding transcriptional regulator AlpA